ncbi:PPOX class F420-dependent oxidoreductase [Actinokineospora sp. NBRC 105648]|uniref:PPOX class F420-dependent oxidoreductase n=1 Tax=Actinokineospora sp. NBRC 105648 TaxID=3032206 RepID=UPI0024A1F196|nr:PPOX class F420-dependent oxidoreductase [Actinokineospora sp. NBRC 105648]GLZ39411.1 PPOX class F420-dependent oxidoreductase [Actinokineospora sp. NBRC 105648]
MDEVTRLGQGKYVLVTTFKRDGTAVPTPVWAATDGAELLVWTVRGSGKVKRIRNSDRVELAPCDLRGRPSGPSVPGSARLLDAAGSERARKIIQRKYGVLGWLTIAGSKLRRGADGTIGIAITPRQGPPAA